MTSRNRWVRRSRVWRDGRWHAGAPLTLAGGPASSTDAATWSSYTSAAASSVGVGIGFMLGDGIGCYDLDNVTDDQARAFIAGLTEPVVFIERSQSGLGVHVFIEAPETFGWKRTVNGISVERYTRQRYIAVTGNTFTP